MYVGPQLPEQNKELATKSNGKLITKEKNSDQNKILTAK